MHNFKWIHMHDYVSCRKTDNIVFCKHTILVPICTNARNDFLKDFMRMNIYCNNTLCLDVYTIFRIASSLGTLQNIFFSSICQTVMSEPLVYLKQKLPGLICAECGENREPIHVYIDYDHHLDCVTTTAYKQLRLVKYDEISEEHGPGHPRRIEIKVSSTFRNGEYTAVMSVACSKSSAISIFKSIF